MSIITRLLGVATAVATLPACDREPVVFDDPDPARWAAFADDVPPLTRGSARFAMDLYAQLAATTEGNLFVSPMSISAALTMTTAGAAGGTAEEMAAVLHLAGLDERVHGTWALFMRELHADQGEGVELRIANRLWGQQGYPFRPEFLGLLREEYGAEMALADFVADFETPRGEINEWVKTRTSGRIPELMPPGVLDQLTRLVLVNAIWFKGTWAEPFTPDHTREAPFRIDADREARVRMMSMRDESFRYAETDDVQVLEMPYEGDTVAMLIVLPRAVGLEAVEANLSVATLDAWLDAMQNKPVDVWLPSFELRSRVRLEETLKTLGMTSAFEPGAADFSAITGGPNDLYLSAVVHEAWVKVDEEGTEAAAATGAVMTATAFIGPKEFRADRPFLVLIRHRPTGAILFMGRVADPS